MRSKFKRFMAVLATVAMCSTTLLNFPSDVFNYCELSAFWKKVLNADPFCIYTV